MAATVSLFTAWSWRTSEVITWSALICSVSDCSTLLRSVLLAGSTNQPAPAPPPISEAMKAKAIVICRQVRPKSTLMMVGLLLSIWTFGCSLLMD